MLSADHGGPEAPGHLNSLGIPAKYVTPEQWDKAPAIGALKQKFGIGKELIQAYRHPYVYLNREVIQEKGLDPAVVEKAVVEELMKFDGVALAVSSTALSEGNLPNTPHHPVGAAQLQPSALRRHLCCLSAALLHQ